MASPTTRFTLSRRAFMVLAGTALATGCLSGTAFAATYVAPEEPRETGLYATTAVHAAAEAVAYYLGIDNTTVRQSSFNPTEDDYATQNFFGLFGSSMNQNPDTYLWNYFYNFYAAENGLILAGDDAVPQFIAGGGPGMADDSGASVALRPDIIIGISSSDTSTSYAAQIAAVEENNDDDPDNDYDPYLVPWSANSYTFIIQNMHQIVEAAQQVGKPTRYDAEDGEPASGALEAVQAYEDIVLGAQYYVLQQIDEGNVGRACYLYVSSVDTSTNTITLSSNEIQSLESSDRLLAAVENVADNVIDKYPELVTTVTVVSDRDGSESESAAITAADLATLIEAEGDNLVIISIEEGLASGVESSDLGTILTEAGLTSEQISALRIFSQTGGFIHNQMTASEPNGPEYGLYVPELLGYIYNSVIDQTDLIGLYFYKVYHIVESEVQSAIDQACENITTADNLTLSDDYQTSIQEKLESGKAYYAENADALIASYPKLASYDDACALWTTELTTENTVLVSESVSLASDGVDGVIRPGDVAVQMSDGTALSETQSVNTKFYGADGTRVYSITEPGTYIIQIAGIRSELSGSLAEGTASLGYTGTVELEFEVTE